MLKPLVTVLSATLLLGSGAALAQTTRPGLWDIQHKMGGDPEIDRAMAEMQKQLAAMPPAQRKQMEAMMGLMDIFRRKPMETRSSGTGYSAQIIAARNDYIRGASGLGELTAAVQSSVSLWESAMALADVKGTPMLTRRAMALTARALALRRNFLIGLIHDNPNAQMILNMQQGILEALRDTDFELVVRPVDRSSPEMLDDVRSFMGQ